MDQIELLSYVVKTLERIGDPYFITGSIASMSYGDTRFTNDIDIVVELSPSSVRSIVLAFPDDEFYLSQNAIEAALGSGGQFNIIHPESGLKIDLMVADQSAFNRSRFSRMRRLAISPDLNANFASPEDVILKKLVYFKEGGSQKHLRDIAGIMRSQGVTLDAAYLIAWAVKLGVESEWKKVQQATG